MSIKTSSIYTSGNNVYFYSDRVKVFPCAYRNNKYDATARLNTEYNFTHLPHMVDKASYIIEFTEEKLICVIQGYYFEIELGDSDSENKDSDKLENKYLNICVASPNGAGSIESPHLCSWDKLSSIEGTLDIEQIGGTFFAGLKIGDGVLSNGAGYQCYALKLDDSATLPIMANKIENIVKNSYGVENGTGKPISQEFTTETLSATTSISTPELKVASDKLIAKSNGITAKVPVTINNTLEVKDSTATTSILKAEDDQVVINKPTTINDGIAATGTGSFGGKLTVTAGGADITGTTQISKSSSEATDGNLTVAGTVGITGKTTIGTGGAVTEIENDTIKTSKITIEKASNTGSLVIDKTKNNIIEIKNSSDESIFSVDTGSGETWAKKIKAPIEGISDDAENVKTSINGKSITDIFETNGLVVQKASGLTATSSTNSAGNIIIAGNTTGIVDALIPAKAEGRTYNIGSSNETFDNIYADNIYATTFYGSLDGNAKTATAFKEAASITLTGDVITSTAATGTHGWTVNTTIDKGAVTNDKLVNDSITIGSNTVVLGHGIGTKLQPFKGQLYFKGLLRFGKVPSGGEKDNCNIISENDNCHIVITGQYPKSGIEFPLEIEDSSGRSLIQFTNNYGTSGTTSVPKQIIYAATSRDQTKGKTELFGDKICIYAQSKDYASGTIEAGTVDLSKGTDNTGLKIKELAQIKVNDAGLKSSSALRIVKKNSLDCVLISNGSSVTNSLLVGGLAEFSVGATFKQGISVVSGDVKINNDKLTLSASNGNIVSKGTIEAASFNATSDRRLKENIIDYKPEKSILDLPIKKFDFIDGPKNQIGCIAQDLKEICPEIVNENEKGYLSIQESKLIYLLLDEVKKLKNEVEELKNK